jgi:SAM-dependent methyltransferase
MWLNVGCGTHRAPKPWWNVDVHEGDDVWPDQVVEAGEPLPFDDGSCERVLASHVLEHVPWEDVPAFVTDLGRVLAPGGELLVVGPDVYKTLWAWRRGLEPWHIVEAVLEHQNYPADMAAWPGAPHHWNCHTARVIEVLKRAELGEVLAADEDEAYLATWPVVGWNARWQLALQVNKEGGAVSNRSR